MLEDLVTLFPLVIIFMMISALVKSLLKRRVKPRVGSVDAWHAAANAAAPVDQKTPPGPPPLPRERRQDDAGIVGEGPDGWGSPAIVGALILCAGAFVAYDATIGPSGKTRRAKREMVEAMSRRVSDSAASRGVEPPQESRAAQIPGAELSSQQRRLIREMRRRAPTALKWKYVPEALRDPVSIAQYPDGVPAQFEYRWRGEVIEQRSRFTVDCLGIGPGWDQWGSWVQIIRFPGASRNEFVGTGEIVGVQRPTASVTSPTNSPSTKVEERESHGSRSNPQAGGSTGEYSNQQKQFLESYRPRLPTALPWAKIPAHLASESLRARFPGGWPVEHELRWVGDVLQKRSRQPALAASGNGDWTAWSDVARFEGVSKNAFEGVPAALMER